MKIVIDDTFNYVDRKNFVCLESEFYGDLLIKATPDATNGEWEMYLNGYKICSYRGEREVQYENNIYFSEISELDESERLGFYQEFVICQRQIVKKMIYKTDINYKYHFIANIVPLYFEAILLFIRNDLLNILADSDFDTNLAESKYVGGVGLNIPNYLSYDDMMKFIDALLEDNEPYWKRIELLDSFEKETGALIYKYGHYRLVDDLSKFLELERKLIKANKLKNYGTIFSPEYIVANLRHKSGVKLTLGSVRTAVSRSHNPPK
jgi:hypothetical protein